MNNWSITSEQYIRVWIGWVSFTQMLVSSLDSMLIQYDAGIFFGFSGDSSIHDQISWTTVALLLNDIFVSH